MVYFIEIVGLGQVKIGYSARNVASRVDAARPWADVRVLLVIPDASEKDEKWFHRQLHDIRVTRERFRLTDELRAWITEMAGGFDWDAAFKAKRRPPTDAARRKRTTARARQRKTKWRAALAEKAARAATGGPAERAAAERLARMQDRAAERVMARLAKALSAVAAKRTPASAPHVALTAADQWFRSTPREDEA